MIRMLVPTEQHTNKCNGFYICSSLVFACSSPHTVHNEIVEQPLVGSLINTERAPVHSVVGDQLQACVHTYACCAVLYAIL